MLTLLVHVVFSARFISPFLFRSLPSRLAYMRALPPPPLFKCLWRRFFCSALVKFLEHAPRSSRSRSWSRCRRRSRSRGRASRLPELRPKALRGAFAFAFAQSTSATRRVRTCGVLSGDRQRKSCTKQKLTLAREFYVSLKLFLLFTFSPLFLFPYCVRVCVLLFVFFFGWWCLSVCIRA